MPMKMEKSCQIFCLGGVGQWGKWKNRFRQLCGVFVK